MSVIETEKESFACCAHCWRDRQELERLIACLEVSADGARNWFWWCRRCEVQTGWGVSLPEGTLDLGLLGEPDTDNDFEVFDHDGALGIFPTA